VHTHTYLLPFCFSHLHGLRHLYKAEIAHGCGGTHTRTHTCIHTHTCCHSASATSTACVISTKPRSPTGVGARAPPATTRSQHIDSFAHAPLQISQICLLTHTHTFDAPSKPNMLVDTHTHTHTYTSDAPSKPKMLVDTHTHF